MNNNKLIMIIKFKGEELMQKWRKVLLVSIFIMAIIGGLIGFSMAKSGIKKVKVLANIDMFGIFMLILLIIIVICMIVDIHGIYKSKKQFGTAKFKVIIKTRKRLRNCKIHDESETKNPTMYLQSRKIL